MLSFVIRSGSWLTADTYKSSIIDLGKYRLMNALHAEIETAIMPKETSKLQHNENSNVSPS